MEIPNIIGNKTHPTEKPVELNKILIENSTEPQEVVLDCFMGTGSSGVACKLLDRNFIGIEIDEKYYKIAVERINNIKDYVPGHFWYNSSCPRYARVENMMPSCIQHGNA